jgi:methylmalonyl-CoA mutase
MTFHQATAAEWRARVDKELAGAPFDKTLVGRTAEGIAIQPLYVEGPKGGPLGVESRAEPFRVCMRVGMGASRADVAAELAGGAEGLWLPSGGVDDLLGGVDVARIAVVVDPGKGSPAAILEGLSARAKDGASPVMLGVDPLGELAAGRLAPSDLATAKEGLVAAARLAEERLPHAAVATVSTLPYHDAGADGADEIAFALSTGAAYIEMLLQAGLSPEAASRRVAFRVASGQSTFGELAKLRALRVVWGKVLAAAGARSAPGTLVHAVCSSRTLAQRDPWVNMLRVTTQVFAAILGGADLVTPTCFDQALGSSSALGRRIARNTGLVLREESSIGKVRDPAGGSYYFDTMTDALAREAWKRFQALERDGGLEVALTAGRIRARLDAAWRGRLDLLTKRRAPVLGVSEFANLDEILPSPARLDASAPTSPEALPTHRDAEPFEELRFHAEAAGSRPEALLVALGPVAESRPRVGFATNFFGAGGIRVRETGEDAKATVACLCGSDQRYAAEAALRARTLKALGCKRVLLAGRPGDLEVQLRQAGVDAFLYVGCDAVALLSELLGAFR